MKCHNDHYAYKLELHDKLHHSQQGRKQVELKERDYRAIFKKESTDVGTDEEKIPVLIYLG